MKGLNKYYFSKRDFFFYIKLNNKEINRDNKISNILGENANIELYLGDGVVDDISLARFWKDENSARKSMNNHFFINSKLKKFDKSEVVKIDRKTFLKIIPDTYEVKNHVTLKNSKLKEEESKYLNKWCLERKMYKAISAYIKVDQPYRWLPCKDCGLIPLIWEFNNGRNTACGCGENEYKHHSISAESIMSYVTRNNGSALNYNSDELRTNWNHWVKTGEDLFKIKKVENDKIW